VRTRDRSFFYLDIVGKAAPDVIRARLEFKSAGLGRAGMDDQLCHKSSLLSERVSNHSYANDRVCQVKAVDPGITRMKRVSIRVRIRRKGKSRIEPLNQAVLFSLSSSGGEGWGEGVGFTAISA
jgi:hypothetical protein